MANWDEDKVSYGTKTFLENALKQHDAVESFSGINHREYHITRKRGDHIRLYLTGLYVFSENDLYDVCNNNSEVNCIVSGAPWNRISGCAVKEAKKRRVGLFKVGEFLGCLNWEKFWEYTPKKK
jgi:hypothetical protein